jgi:hypothetical protein
MTKVLIHFKDGGDNVEIAHVRTIKFEDGVSAWCYRHNGRTETLVVDIADIAYVEVQTEPSSIKVTTAQS